ncbi:hypothetical protein ANANG_G00164970 [Anguilla anguilla]|uniref:Klotho n=1 Tax=Anguilla anguilla TaxID=7936 RepID=A0A9D3MF34_ANGAN|nr:hypothetical protein ANANG_G00164970 [Anguilla anguilla]
MRVPSFLLLFLTLSAEVNSAAAGPGAGQHTWERFNKLPYPYDQAFLYDTFPDGFMWSVGTSSYSVEGAFEKDGKGPSVWDTFTRGGNRKAMGDVGSDSYHNIQGDIRALQQLGVSHYRFSLSWPRIFSNGTRASYNERGVAYYKTLIQKLKEIGVQPVVTLYHWDLPDVLQRRYGGWSNPILVDLFEDYADFCFETFGDDVKFWITIDNPFVVAWHGYGTGIMAPGIKNDPDLPFRVGHILLKAHAAAWHVYNERYRPLQGGKVSMALGSHWIGPSRTRRESLPACQCSLNFVLGWFARPLFVDGDYPRCMRSVLSARLPSFGPAERPVNGTADFFALSFGPSLSFQLSNEPEVRAEGGAGPAHAAVLDPGRVRRPARLHRGERLVRQRQLQDRGPQAHVLPEEVHHGDAQVDQVRQGAGDGLHGLVAGGRVRVVPRVHGAAGALLRGLRHAGHAARAQDLRRVLQEADREQRLPAAAREHARQRRLPLRLRLGRGRQLHPGGDHALPVRGPQRLHLEHHGQRGAAAAGGGPGPARGAPGPAVRRLRRHPAPGVPGGAHARHPLPLQPQLVHAGAHGQRVGGQRQPAALLPLLRRRAAARQRHPGGQPVALHPRQVQPAGAPGGPAGVARPGDGAGLRRVRPPLLPPAGGAGQVLDHPQRAQRQEAELRGGAQPAPRPRPGLARPTTASSAGPRGGRISLTLHADWVEPAYSFSRGDAEPAARILDFRVGWFAEPVFGDGDYPAGMRAWLQQRTTLDLFSYHLPAFSAADRRLVRGTYDFFALSHFSTTMVSDVVEDRYSFEGRLEVHYIYDVTWIMSPRRGSPVVPWGLRKVLNWVDSRYKGVPIYVMSNGVDEDPARFKDSLRVYYLYNYINEALKAYKLDGVNLQGYFAYALSDERDPGFGMYGHVSDEHIAKSSLHHYRNIIHHNGFPAPASTPQQCPRLPSPAPAATSSPSGQSWASSHWSAPPSWSPWG